MHTTAIPHRLACLCERELPEIEVVNGNICRRRWVEGLWPATVHHTRLPLSMRVEVMTPAGIVMKVCVRFMLIGEYVYASASPVDRAHGEDPLASGAFPEESEVKAEKLALSRL